MAINERLIPRDRSVIVALDCDPEDIISVVTDTHDVDGISGYKIGMVGGLELSLRRATARIKHITTDKPVIYDHQKAGNDIPEMDEKFAETCARAGVDAVIFFPFASPVTEKRWISAAQGAGLKVLVGGHMTVPKFLKSEGGFIADDAPDRIYTIAAENGVRDFVVPGNKVEYVEHYRGLLDNLLGEGNFDLHAPGFVAQGGKITDMAQVAGKRWHAIVGSAIYKAADKRAAAEQMTAQIR